MSISLITWLGLYGLLAVMAFKRPVWGVALYFLSFFGDPAIWWWGVPIASIRWNLIAAIIAVAAVIIHERRWMERGKAAWISILVILIGINATLVHFALAPDMAVSTKSYELLMKFVMLFFLMKAAIIDRSDLITVIMVFAVALGHIGYEVKFNDAGSIVKGRLEHVGPPTASASNELGSLHTTLLPLMGAVLLCGTRRQQLLVLLCAPFAVNTLLMGKSRGALLGLVLSAPVFLAFAPARARRLAIYIVLLGGVGTLLLMRDESISKRFFTAFADEEHRDASAADRLEYWKAGLAMIKDYPLGAGGDGFSDSVGMKYLAAEGFIFENRSVHNGYINEACQWGIQGLLLRLALLVCAAWVALTKARELSRSHSPKDALLGAAMLAGLAGYCFTCMFSDLLDNEWGYWMAALIAAYDRVCVPETSNQTTLYRLVPLEAASSYLPAEAFEALRNQTATAGRASP